MDAPTIDLSIHQDGALIGGDQIVDFYSTYEDAIKVGYATFRLTPFLVKQVNRLEPVRFVSRLVAPQSLRTTG